MLKAVSNQVARAEVFVAASLAGAVTLLVLLNIVSRALGHAIYWVDELAIYCMVWMTFFTTSVLLKKRQSVAVTILTDCFQNSTIRFWLALVSDLMVLLFALLLFWLCWRWYDPVTLAGTGFDLQAFQAQTFNFMYAENTSTLELKKFWVWSVLPLFAASLSLHALSNLVEQLRPTPVVAGEAV